MKALIDLLALGVLVLGSGAMVRRPGRTILPLYAGLVPVGSVFSLPIPLPPPFNSLSSLLGALAIVAVLLHLAIFRRPRVPELPVGLWLLFLAWICTTIFWTIDPSSSKQALMLALPLLLLVFVCAVLRFDERDLYAWRLAIILGGIAVGLYAFSLLIRGAPLPTHGVTQRFSIQTGVGELDPNILAASLLLPISLSVERLLLGGSVLLRPRTWRVLGGAGVFFCLAALLLTGSRGGVVAAFIAVFGTVIACRGLAGVRRRGTRVGRSTIAVVVAVAGVVLVLQALGLTLLAPLQAVRNVPVLERLGRTTSSGRAEIWKAGWFACRIHCAKGSGLGSFEIAYDNAFALTGVTRNVGLNRPAHNVYLLLMVETGFLGLSLFLFAVGAEWVQLSRARAVRLAPALRAVLASELVAVLFLSTIWFKYFWLPILLARVVESAARDHERVPFALTTSEPVVHAMA